MEVDNAVLAPGDGRRVTLITLDVRWGSESRRSEQYRKRGWMLWRKWIEVYITTWHVRRKKKRFYSK
jgi:hypothetical protein